MSLDLSNPAHVKVLRFTCRRIERLKMGAGEIASWRSGLHDVATALGDVGIVWIVIEAIDALTDRNAALAARNELERRNLALLKDIGNLDTAAYWRSAHAAACRRGVDSADRASKYMRDLVEMDQKYAEQGSELLDERRRHAETAASLSLAEKRVEELSAELAAERAAKVAAREQRDRAIEVACTCIDGETLDDLLASAPVIMPPCPLHPEGKR